MFFSLIITCVLFLLFWLLIKHKDIALIISVYIGIIVFVITWSAYSRKESVSFVSKRTDIYSLTEEDTFVFGYHDAGNYGYYVFCLKDKNGTYQTIKVPQSKNLVLIESESEQPKIIRYSTKLAKTNWFWAVKDCALSNKYEKTVIYIPKNAILKNI